MSCIAEYLFKNITVTIFLCLMLGYLLGKIKIGSFTVGATAGSLIAGLAVGLFIYQFSTATADDKLIGGPLSSLFFALFCFAIGFEVGPAFFSSLKATGLKIVVLSVFFSAVGLVMVYILTKALGLDAGIGAGLIAGALTQSAVLGVVSKGMETNAQICYALTYVFGMIGVILFAKRIAPMILGKDLRSIAKEKIDSVTPAQQSGESQTAANIVQVRAFRLEDGSPYCGYSVDEIEDNSGFPIEIVAVYRGNECVTDFANGKLQASDVIQTVGHVTALDSLDNDCGLTEVSDAKYFQIKLVDAEIVLTGDYTEETEELLSDHGIYVKNHTELKKMKKHGILRVTGPQKAIAKAAKQIGYLKESGDAADMSSIALFIAVGLMIGAVGVGKFSLGSVAVLIMGMVIGWYYNKKPKFGYIPSSARWLMKNLGLNLFILVTALNSAGGLAHLTEWDVSRFIVILLAGAVLTLVPHIVSLLFGKYVLHINDADLLGGLCGCGTCTPGLNALAEESESSVFAIGYAPGCAAGNILLVAIAMIYMAVF